MFWNRFSDLCLSVGMSPNAVAKELKIPSGSITAWKNGVTPRPLTVKKIADYFGVNVEYVLYGGYPGQPATDEKNPADLKVDEASVSRYLKDMTAAQLADLMGMVAKELKERGL